MKNRLSYFLIPFNFAFGENTSTGNLIRTERAEACREICKLGNGFLLTRIVHSVQLTDLLKTNEVNGCGAFTWNSSTRFCELKQAQEGSWKYCEGLNHFTSTHISKPLNSDPYLATQTNVKDVFILECITGFKDVNSDMFNGFVPGKIT